MKDKCRKLREKIQKSFVEELRQSIFFQVDFRTSLERCLKELGDRKISKILCYGLGSFHSGVDVTSKYQLALLILLHEHLSEAGLPLSSVIEVYDPSFEQLDKDTLTTFTEPQFELIPINEYCARKLEASDTKKCILVYMPHLDKFLYNNLLGSNWEPSKLSQLVILGNSFSEMVDNEIPSKCKSELHFLNLLVNDFKLNEYKEGKSKNKKATQQHNEKLTARALIEVSLDDSSFAHQDVFNSLSFHFIDKTWLMNNAEKLQQNWLHNWTYVTSCLADD